MTNIARACGVSKNTVSLALRNDPQIPEKTRQKIQQAATKMGYTPHPVVANLMAQLRAGGATGTQATLALLNANQNQNAFTEHPTIPTYIEGCKKRASHLGYALDIFWLHQPELDGERLNRILKSRGIRAAVIVGLMNSNRLPERFEKIWHNYPCVVTGVRTRDPALSFACTDHHIITLRAFEHALALGYQRPGLVLDEVIDRLVEGRFTAGYREAQQALPLRRRLHPFSHVEAARRDRTVFRRWFEKEQPDVIFTLYNEVHEWVIKLGYAIPDQVGLIQLEWRQSRPEWAGMNQHNDVAGEAAIDMVVAMLHNGEIGPPPFPKATLIGGSWIDGRTVRSETIGTITAGYP